MADLVARKIYHDGKSKREHQKLKRAKHAWPVKQLIKVAYICITLTCLNSV